MGTIRRLKEACSLWSLTSSRSWPLPSFPPSRSRITRTNMPRNLKQTADVQWGIDTHGNGNGKQWDRECKWKAGVKELDPSQAQWTSSGCQYMGTSLYF